MPKSLWWSVKRMGTFPNKTNCSCPSYFYFQPREENHPRGGDTRQDYLLRHRRRAPHVVELLLNFLWLLLSVVMTIQDAARPVVREEEEAEEAEEEEDCATAPCPPPSCSPSLGIPSTLTVSPPDFCINVCVCVF